MSRLEWKRTVTSKPGWYLWRNIMEEDPEVIQVWGLRRGERANNVPNYGWQPRRIGEVLLIGKRMHDPEGVEHDELSGYFLCEAGDTTKAPLSVDELLQRAEAPVEDGIEQLREAAVAAEASREVLVEKIAALEAMLEEEPKAKKVSRKKKAKGACDAD